jgi:hypothetical protein
VVGVSATASGSGDVEFDSSPPRLGVALATVAAFVAASATGAVPIVLPIGLAGLLAVAGGTLRASGRLVTLGFVALLAGVVVAGAFGAGPEPLLIALAGALLAWDVGTQAIDLGASLEGADATRPLLVHAAFSTVVAVTAAGGGYAVFRLASGGRPVAAVVFLLLGALVILVALRV